MLHFTFVYFIFLFCSIFIYFFLILSSKCASELEKKLKSEKKVINTFCKIFIRTLPVR